MGVNDYVKKPFHPKELQLRAERWLGVRKAIQKTQNLQYHQLSYNGSLHEFHWNDKHLKLSKRQKDLLLLFLQRPEALLSHQYLEEQYWGDRGKHSHNLRSAVRDLKQSLAPECAHLIQSRRGEGYLLLSSKPISS